MRHRSAALFLMTLFACSSLLAQKFGPLPAPKPRPGDDIAAIQSAKTVFFQDRAGVVAVADAARDQLKKWPRFQLVTDSSQADLLLVLSSDPPRSGNIVFSGGQTGRINSDGSISEDTVPVYLKSLPVRDAYLSVYDRRTGQLLWTRSHQWGGLLTGKNSAGSRLVSQLERSVKK